MLVLKLLELMIAVNDYFAALCSATLRLKILVNTDR